MWSDFNIHTKAALVVVSQDFMTSMMTMGLSQVVSAPTHTVEHTLDLVFCTRVDVGDMGVEELSAVPLSWTDHYLISFKGKGSP